MNEAFEGGDRKRLRALADKLVEKALGGDITAMKEIGDRLDGRPAQTIKATVDSTVSVVSEDEIAKADQLLGQVVKSPKCTAVH